MALDPGDCPTLETSRLRLAPLVLADHTLVFHLVSNPEVMAHWDFPEIDDPDLVEDLVDGQIATMEMGRAFYWSMRRLADGDFIGVCDLSDIDRWHRRAEIGFVLGRGAWGQGYAVEAMQAVIAHAASLGIRRLGARIHLGNHRSGAVLTRLGFHEEGLLRGHVERDGERRDCQVFGLLL